MLLAIGVAISGLAGIPSAVNHTKLCILTATTTDVSIVLRAPVYRMLCGIFPGTGGGLLLEAILTYNSPCNR